MRSGCELDKLNCALIFSNIIRAKALTTRYKQKSRAHDTAASITSRQERWKRKSKNDGEARNEEQELSRNCCEAKKEIFFSFGLFCYFCFFVYVWARFAFDEWSVGLNRALALAVKAGIESSPRFCFCCHLCRRSSEKWNGRMRDSNERTHEKKKRKKRTREEITAASERKKKKRRNTKEIENVN